MQWSDISFRPDTRKLRQFAALWVPFFGALAAWQALVRGNASAAIALGLLAVAVGSLGLLRPQAIRVVYVGWMVLAFPIGWTVSRLVLAGLFYGLLTPLALFFRLLGRDPLQRRARHDLSTYWSEKPSVKDPGRYFKQF
jgi:saxitoxin biosynthesis operon SxtJ-like protein